MKPVSLTTAAKNEIERAAQYYEQQREGLGLRFTDKVEEAIDRIALNPLAYRKIIGEARRAALAKFPYQMVHNQAGRISGNRLLARTQIFGLGTRARKGR